MPQPQCAICGHEEVAAIDAALAAGQAVRAVAGRFALSKSTLQRHAGHASLSTPLPAPAAAGPAQEAGAPRPMTRLRTCLICQMPDEVVERLDAALGASEPSQNLALEYSVSLNQLLNHQLHRASEAVSRQRYESEQDRSTDTSDSDDRTRRLFPVQRPITSLMVEADRLHQATLRAASPQQMMLVTRQLAALVLRLAQVVEER